jgi:glycosyltransferase involved in cell wall biosynthesis
MRTLALIAQLSRPREGDARPLVCYARPMLSGVRVAVVVPAYQEAPRIERVLRGMPDGIDHVIVVDDASRDDTAARGASLLDPRVEVVSHAHNRGVGAAIATGYRRAMQLVTGPRDALVVMAGDGQMDPADLPTLVAPIAEGAAGYVKGDRFAWPGGARLMPPARRVGGQAFSWLTSRAIGRAVSDSQCGYTALARSACERLDLERMWPRFGYPNDLLGELTARGIPIREVPVRPVYADEESKMRAYHVAAIAFVVARAWARRRYRLNFLRSAAETTAGA